MQRTTFEEFIQNLQQVLSNLYDPAELRKSSLIHLFGLETRPNPGLALQDIIADAIQQLRPRIDVPLQSNAWRYYNILLYHYVEQYSQALVADTLGLSVRQLRREERESERILAEFLWRKYNLDLDTQRKNGETDLDRMVSRADETTGDSLSPSSHEKEMLWLQEGFPQGNLSVEELIASVLQVVSPLAQSTGREIICTISDNLPPLNGHITAMRQAMLNLLLVSLQSPQGDQVIIKIENENDMAAVSIQSSSVQPSEQVDELIKMANALIPLFCGEFTFSLSPEYKAVLQLPVLEQTPVLVIDDNADTLQLMRRFLHGTPYRFIGLREPEKAIEMIQEHQPRLIVMDVMMPGMDDWELLGRVRTHPDTQHIPVIICTILPQEFLAKALGSAGFMRKPVNRDAFLALLKEQIGRGDQKPD
jgi:CheY-like chemotaxis protein